MIRLASRLWKLFVGFVLLFAGLCITYAFFRHTLATYENIWSIGLILVIQMYSILGSLFIAIGLQYIFGPITFIRRFTNNSLRDLLVIMIMVSLLTTAAIVAALFYR